MRLLPQLGIAVALAAQLGCADSPTKPTEQLVATPLPAGLALTNHTDGPVAYFVISVDALGYTEFILCDDPATCPGPKLAPGETAVLLWSSMSDYRGPGQEYDVMWTYGPHQHYLTTVRSK